MPTNPIIIKQEYNTQSTQNKKRNKYAMYSFEVKRQCIDMVKRHDIKEVAAKYAVPLKSLKRWIQIGPERKKGGGRKVRDPSMEYKLFTWYKNLKTLGFFVNPRMIKTKALELTTMNDFNASKGWLAKFSKKFELDLYCNFKKRIHFKMQAKSQDDKEESNFLIKKRLFNVEKTKSNELDEIENSGANAIKFYESGVSNDDSMTSSSYYSESDSDDDSSSDSELSYNDVKVKVEDDL